MKRYMHIVTLLLLLTGCDNKQAEKGKRVFEVFDCQTGLMKSAWYEMGLDEPCPQMNGLPNAFLILVDTQFKATNFISSGEDFFRERSMTLDTSDLHWMDGWEKLTSKQKFEKVEQEKKYYLTQADSTHIINNQGQQRVWILNHSKDTVTIQMQDSGYICVLQAKTKGGQWYPIQYWNFSWCGNSYYFKYFPPKMANSFITQLPDEGDYKTKLRYKLLGADMFYYSNEFDGTIQYCEFVEDSTNYLNQLETPHPHFTLDTVLNLAWQ